MRLQSILGGRLGTLIADHPRIATAAAVGVPLVAVGTVLAVRHFSSHRGGPEAAATGATLLTAESFTPEHTAHLQPAFEIYDTNHSGRIEMRTEGSRWEVNVDLWCEDAQGRHQKQGIFRHKCDVPRSRATLYTLSIAHLLKAADRNHNSIVTMTELDNVLRRYDTHDAMGAPGRDGTLQESEFHAFLVDWGERVAHTTILPPGPSPTMEHT